MAIKRTTIKTSGKGLIFFGYPESGPDCTFALIIPIKLVGMSLPDEVTREANLIAEEEIHYLNLHGYHKQKDGWVMYNEGREGGGSYTEKDIRDRYLSSGASPSIKEHVAMHSDVLIRYDTKTLVYKILEIKIRILKSEVFKNTFTILEWKRRETEFFIAQRFFKENPDELADKKKRTYCTDRWDPPEHKHYKVDKKLPFKVGEGCLYYYQDLYKNEAKNKFDKDKSNKSNGSLVLYIRVSRYGLLQAEGDYYYKRGKFILKDAEQLPLVGLLGDTGEFHEFDEIAKEMKTGKVKLNMNIHTHAYSILATFTCDIDYRFHNKDFIIAKVGAHKVTHRDNPVIKFNKIVVKNNELHFV